MKMSNRLSCCFTGHRPNSLPFGYNETDRRCVKLRKLLKKQIEYLIKECRVEHFITGMALGVDLICAEIVIELKKKYPHITLESAIPCETQAVKWSESQRDRYFHIAEHCDKETLLQHHYNKYCMMKRNKYMVDSSEYVIAVWNGSQSGTGNTVKYAQAQHKAVIAYQCACYTT